MAKLPGINSPEDREAIFGSMKISNSRKIAKNVSMPPPHTSSCEHENSYFLTGLKLTAKRKAEVGARRFLAHLKCTFLEKRENT